MVQGVPSSPSRVAALKQGTSPQPPETRIKHRFCRLTPVHLSLSVILHFKQDSRSGVANPVHTNARLPPPPARSPQHSGTLLNPGAAVELLKCWSYSQGKSPRKTSLPARLRGFPRAERGHTPFPNSLVSAPKLGNGLGPVPKGIQEPAPSPGSLQLAPGN